MGKTRATCLESEMMWAKSETLLFVLGLVVVVFGGGVRAAGAQNKTKGVCTLEVP